jgi:hypothetical protein
MHSDRTAICFHTTFKTTCSLLFLLLSVSLTLLTHCQENLEVRDSDMQAFREAAGLKWQQVFHDPGTDDWKEYWTLDGLKAQVTNSAEGMALKAGPTVRDDSSHAVLWTKQSFGGDIRIEYEYTRLDSAVRFVTILYMQATGSGEGPYKTDISEWAHLRTVPAMRTYFNHMNTYHISYAAYGSEPGGPENDYIRARRYLPETGNGLNGTALQPDYTSTGLFHTGVAHKITVIRKGNEIFMYIKNKDNELLCHWSNKNLPAIEKGRIGLRHMFTRQARYRNFKVSVIDSTSR